MKISNHLFNSAGAALSGLLLLSLSSCAQTERTESITADIEAAQMMGRNDARFFVNRNWNDSSELRYRLSLIRNNSDSIKISHGKDFAAAYDSTFISTIRAVNPNLASAVARFNANPE